MSSAEHPVLVSGGDADSSAADARPAAPRKPGPKAANPAELARLLAFAVGALTDLTEQALDAPGLAMTPAEASDIADPAARLLMRAGIGKKLAKNLANGEDYILLAVALAAYGLRVAPVVAAAQTAAREAAVRRRVERAASNGASGSAENATGGHARRGGRIGANAAAAAGDADSHGANTNGAYGGVVFGPDPLGVPGGGISYGDGISPLYR